MRFGRFYYVTDGRRLLTRRFFLLRKERLKTNELCHLVSKARRIYVRFFDMRDSRLTFRNLASYIYDGRKITL